MKKIDPDGISDDEMNGNLDTFWSVYTTFNFINVPCDGDYIT